VRTQIRANGQKTRRLVTTREHLLFIYVEEGQTGTSWQAPVLMFAGYYYENVRIGPCLGLF